MRKSLIYGNWEIQEIDGTILFLTTKKRADWYLNRGLAKKINENKVRLLFNTKGRRSPNDLYSISKKSNSCVVCNSSDISTLTRHHIVPKQYRKHLPENIKSRSSHDIVILCRKHHDEYEILADKLKLKILSDNGLSNKINPNWIQLGLKIAKSIIHYGDKMPIDKLEKLKLEFTEATNINSDIESINNFYKSNIGYKPLSNDEIIVNNLIKTNSQYDFIIMWRKHFIETMCPKFLPEHWDVNYFI